MLVVPLMSLVQQHILQRIFKTNLLGTICTVGNFGDPTVKNYNFEKPIFHY